MMNTELDHSMINVTDLRNPIQALVTEGAIQLGLDSPSAQTLSTELVRDVAPRRSEQRCPTCRSIVYSRRHRLCGVCGQPLPEDYLFSVTEARRIEILLVTERQRHRAWLKRAKCAF